MQQIHICLYLLVAYVHGFQGIYDFRTIGTTKDSTYRFNRFKDFSLLSKSSNKVDSSRNPSVVSLTKQIAKIFAAAATTQIFSSPTIAAPLYDDSFDQITSKLLTKLKSADRDVGRPSISTINEQLSSITESNQVSEISDKAYESIKEVVEISKESFATGDVGPVLQDSIISLRDSVKFLATDWKLWFCAIAAIIAVDSFQGGADLRMNNADQREQIDDLYKKLQILEIQGYNNATILAEMEHITSRSKQDLEALRKQLAAKALEVQAMNVSLQELKELDEQLFMEARNEALLYQEQLQNITIAADLQKEVYAASTSTLTSQLSETRSTIQALTSARDILASSVRDFLLAQRYIGQGQANMIIPSTLPSLLNELSLFVPRTTLELRISQLESEKSQLKSSLQSSERLVETLNKKLKDAHARLETASQLHLAALSKSTDDQTKIAIGIEENTKLRKLLETVSAQLQENDKVAEEATQAATIAVARAVSLEEEILRLQALADSNTNNSAALESAQNQLKQITEKLVDTETRLETAMTARKLLIMTDQKLKELNVEVEQSRLKLENASAVEDALNKSNLRIEAQESELNQLKEKLHEAQQASETSKKLQTRVDELTVDLEHTKDLLSTVTNDQSIKESKLNRLESEYIGMKWQLNATEDLLQKSEHRLSEVIRTLDDLEVSVAQQETAADAKSDVESYIQELRSENEELKQRLAQSDDKFLEIQQEMQNKLSFVQNIAYDLNARLGIRTNVDNSFKAGSELSPVGGADSSKVRTKVSPRRKQEIKAAWRNLSKAQLERKTKKSFEEALLSLGVSTFKGKPISQFEKKDLMEIMSKQLVVPINSSKQTK